VTITYGNILWLGMNKIQNSSLQKNKLMNSRTQGFRI